MSADLELLARVVKLTVLGGWGFPLAWFADPADSNRATLSEQGTPTARALGSMQTDLRMFLRSLCDFQIAIKRVLAPEELSGVDEGAEFPLLTVHYPSGRESVVRAGVVARVRDQEAARERFFG